MDAAHPLRVALGEVVVDGDDVDAVAGQCVQVRREGGDEGLALTGAHLGDVAEVQGRATHDLDVVVALAEGPLRGLTDGGEGLRQQVVERLAIGEALLYSSVRARSSASVRSTKSSSIALTALAMPLELAEDLALAGAKDLVEHSHSGATFPLVAGHAQPACERDRPEAEPPSYGPAPDPRPTDRSGATLLPMPSAAPPTPPVLSDGVVRCVRRGPTTSRTSRLGVPGPRSRSCGRRSRSPTHATTPRSWLATRSRPRTRGGTRRSGP